MSEDSTDKEETKKTTVDLPISIFREIKLRCAQDPHLKQGSIFVRALKIYMMSNLSWSKSEEQAIWQLQISPDPEDRLEIPLTVEGLKALHTSVHEALKKAGVSNTDEEPE